MTSHFLLILFTFMLGACVGSFLNVVVWRLPRVEYEEKDSLWRSFGRTFQALTWPPSHCPKCGEHLRWYDNVPVIGWVKLKGKCRFCKQPISPRYPIVEFITGALFAFYYVMFFVFGFAPCAAATPGVMFMNRIPLHGLPLAVSQAWPMYALYMFLIGGLLASSLIDAELFIIPIEIPWVIALVAFVVHAIIDTPALAGALNTNASTGALSAGAAIGTLVSMGLWFGGIMPTSFPQGDPMLEVDRDAAPEEVGPEYTPMQIRLEMRKEMLFLLPPMVMAAVAYFVFMKVPAVNANWSSLMRHQWLTGLLGSIFGALVGAFVVWIFRIMGTIGFGRVAMGLGDVHLMLGVGAVIGAAGATVTFFIAPFFGILLALWRLVTGSRREIPFGPYLSLAAAFVILFICPIMTWLTPGMLGLRTIVQQYIGI